MMFFQEIPYILFRYCIKNDAFTIVTNLQIGHQLLQYQHSIHSICFQGAKGLNLMNTNPHKGKYGGKNITKLAVLSYQPYLGQKHPFSSLLPPSVFFQTNRKLQYDFYEMYQDTNNTLYFFL